MNKTISDKLVQIAENEPKVYEAGHDAGYTEGLNKGGYADGFEAGKQAEYDAFWEVYQQGGDRRIYTYAFYGGRWTDEIYNPKYPITIEGGNGVYQTSNVTDTKVPIDVTNIGNNGQVFVWANKLVTIRKLIVGEDRFSASMFDNCTALENITIEGVIGRNFDIHWSTKLSADSIRSIIEHLSDAKPPEGQPKKTLTLSRTAVDTAVANGGFGDAVSIEPGAISGGSDFYSDPIPLKKGDRLKVELFVSDDHFYPTATWDETKYGDYMEDTQYWGVSLYNEQESQFDRTYRDYVFTAAADTNHVIRAFYSQFMTDDTTPDAIFSIRAVLIDENDNEITGENLYSAVEIYGVSNIGGWAALEASKPNWTITLV